MRIANILSGSMPMPDTVLYCPKKPSHGRAINGEEAIRLYENGLSMSEIGRRLGNDVSSIAYRLHRSGIPIRKAEPKVKRTCPTCTKEFYVYPSRMRNGRNVYCSMKCRGMGHCGPGSPRWTGSRRTESRDGYIWIYCPDHPCSTKRKNHLFLEHRIVIEKFLGRYLRQGEIVHHINGLKTDNRIENLHLSNTRFHREVHVAALTEISLLKKENQDLRLLLALFSISNRIKGKQINA